MNRVSDKTINPDSNVRTTADEERELAPLAREGDSDAIYRLCEGNLGLLYHLAGKYANRIHGFGELVSVGYEAMVSAAKGYNPEEHGRRFGCYAGVCIRNEFKEIFMPGRVIRIPQGTAKKIREIMEVQDRLLSDNGSAPSDEEIVRSTGYDLRLVRRARTDLRLQLSLSAPVAGGDGENLTLEGLLAHPDSRGAVERSDRGHDFGVVIEKINKLGEREREVVLRKYGLGGYRQHTLDEIGESMGFTGSWAGVLLERAHKKLKASIERAPRDFPSTREVYERKVQETKHLGEERAEETAENESGVKFLTEEERKVYVAWERSGRIANISQLSDSTRIPRRIVAEVLKTKLASWR